MPLSDSESIWEVRVANDSDLSYHRRDIVHIARHFTNAARLVDVGM